MNRLPKEIIDLIEPLYNEVGSAEKVGKILNICSSSVLKRLKKKGYTFKHGVKTISYKEALEKFKESNLSVTQFCKQNHLSMKWFLIYLNKHGVFVENKQNIVKFNEHIFDSIDTEEKSYWLGFIYADGFISSLKENSKSNYQFELSLSANDVSHLDKFNVFMEHITNNVHINNVTCNGKICKRCRWSVRNKHLWETLNSYGCTPNKSLTLKFPNKSVFKSEDLIRHFIRGYFDGDGCLSYADKEHKTIAFSILGTKEFLSSCNKYLNNMYIIRKETRKNLYVLGCAGRKKSKAFLFINYLYDNAHIYLDRKFDRYKYFCRLYE